VPIRVGPAFSHAIQAEFGNRRRLRHFAR
jgi:hypothetical protein